MITPSVQRWRGGRDTYRPAGEVIRTSDYEVAEIAGDTEAKRFVVEHHYSGSYPAARFRFGLYHHAALVGVAVYSQPMVDGALRPLPDPRAGVELGRLVLLDDVPANGESWFIARTFELLARHGIEGVVSFSDPSPRRAAATGEVVFGGHVGTIYQASNACYVGRGTPRTLRLLPDGTVFSARAASKIRSRDRGHRYASEQLVRFGAEPLRDSEDASAWLRSALAATTTTMRHPGNHKYVWGLVRSVKRALPASLPYPKIGTRVLDWAADGTAIALISAT